MMGVGGSTKEGCTRDEAYNTAVRKEHKKKETKEE